MSAAPLTAAVPPSLEEIAGLWRGDRLGHDEAAGIATGFAALDRELPGAGWPIGSLTEILTRQSGIGELRMLLPALARITQAGQTLFLITSPELARQPVLPNAPAIADAGIALTQVRIIRPASEREALWSLEQILRAGAPGAVLSWLNRATPAQLRRLQVAVKDRQVAPILFRPEHAEFDSSPAPLRIRLEAKQFRLAVHILKRRGVPASGPVVIDLPQPARKPRGNHANIRLPVPAGRAVVRANPASDVARPIETWTAT